MKLLSIIIPVYNVEKYFQRCLESIFSQEIDESDFEVIIVNDGSSDNSMIVVADILKTHSNIHVIEQDNQGFSIARNNGLSIAEGQYVLFVDADDVLVPASLHSLLHFTSDESFDIITADFQIMTNAEIDDYTYRKYGISIQPEIYTNGDVFLRNFNPEDCYIWHSLYKKEFLNNFNLRFIPGICFEDIPFTVRCFINANKSIKVNLPLYLYRKHSGSQTSLINTKKLLDLNIIMQLLWDTIIEETKTEEEIKKIKDVVFFVLSLELWYLTHDQQLYAKRYEVVEDLKEKIPDLFFKNGLKQRIISYIFKYIPYYYLKIRSFVS